MCSKAFFVILQIREAYKQCTSYAKNVALTREIHRAMEEELQNMDRTLGLRRHRQLAHRRYLQYDGVGPGTTSERQRAHSQRRLDQSRDSVFEKKFQDALRDTDTKQVELYSAWPQSTRVTNNLERVANEMIRDAIRRGEFSDLPGRGQPMMDTYQNPTLSSMEQKINVMLGDSGFLPDWIQLDREIRTHLEKLKGRILAEWNRCGPHPMSRSKAGEWEQNLLVFQQQLEVINKKIRERNLKGPLVGQKVNLKLDKVVSQVISGVLPRPSESEMKAPVERIAEAWDITFMSFVVATSTLLWVCLR